MHTYRGEALALASSPPMPPVVVASMVTPGRNELRFRKPQRLSKSKEEQLPPVWKKSHEVIKLRRPFGNARPSLMERGGNIIDKVMTLELEAFSDEEAAYLISPDAPHSHIVDRVVEVLFVTLCTAPRRCSWNTPSVRREWKYELRLAGEWWLSLRTLPCTANSQEHYPPLIPFGLRSTASENQFIADLTLHMRRKCAVFSLFHLDHLTLTPDRAAVLLFDGILRNDARHLQCLSLPFCEIGAATLLLLLCALTQCHSLQPQLRYLNLSYNWIDASCSNMLAMLLGRTSIRRLSLQGNRLGGGDMSSFYDFLLQGCCLLEELDLSYTRLTSADVCSLISCLPKLRNLEVLLLDGVEIPESKAAALSTAIRRSNLTYVSLKGVSACSGEAYLHRIRSVCRHTLAARGVMRGQSVMRCLAETGSFFEAFAQRSCEWLFLNDSALPESYRAFVTNEPSLPPIEDL
ncbi:uncharacterized protein Tco025E_04137 [Trypanosoma conorhini]|uniref:Uncharacterized protein n=1 Tax=Trypanosoma conorhini TaxID=83891 RepID=A0A3R7LRS7_9TRYP|nr:uncharacterized protein Tco025E_04137 [Trypanosoma conorhini]RNF19436.1 hypothetical protein Tco025E_04137 [Trypanosoma conorhini]